MEAATHCLTYRECEDKNAYTFAMKSSDNAGT
jgi:hypothetical protein